MNDKINNQTKQNDDKFASLSALEYMDELPSSAVNGALYIIFSLIIATVVWSILGTTDVVISAKGILVPKGQIQEVFSDKAGIAMKIYVKEGQEIRKGDSLIKLNTNAIADIRTEIQKNNEELKLKKLELKVKKEQFKTNQNELISSLNIAKEQFSIKKNKLIVSKSSLKRIKEQYSIRKNMFDNELISKLELLKEEDGLEKAQNTLKETQLDIETFKLQSLQEKEQLETKIITTKLEVDQILSKIELFQRELKMLFLQLNNNESASNGLVDYDIITSPIDGIISKTMVKHESDYIQAGDILFEIIPKDQPLVARIEIPNTGIGRVSKGMSVKLKYDGYPYQQYGIGNGIIEYISPNSRVIDEKKQEFVFDAVVSLDKTHLKSKSGIFPLFTGLTIQSEIVIEEKQLIQFVLETMVGQK